ADWPQPYTISQRVRDLKKQFVDSFTDEGGEEKERDLNYIVAVSSGKAVSEEIPSQIGRRAGWASQQGANFVELLIENPAQLEMDSDMLINLADQLDLHYNIHSSTSMAYGMSYRRGRGNGYDSAHEYTVKLLKSIRRFRTDLESRGLSVDGNGHPRLYAVNGHMAIAQFPQREERLAQDVSVDPFGESMEESDIFAVTEARLGIWKYFIWDYQGVQNDVQEFASILGNIDEVNDAQDYIQANLVSLLEERGYVTDELLSFVNDLQGVEQGDQVISRLFGVSGAQLRDLPATTQGLRNHTNGTQLAQYVATSNPQAAYAELPDQVRDQLVDPVLENIGRDIPDVQALDLTTPEWDRLQEEAQQAITATESDGGVGGDAFADVTEFFRDGGEQAAEAMRNMARSRRLYRDEFHKESSIFLRIIPLWMPFAEEEQVQQIWENITDQAFDDHEEAVDWMYEGGDRAMDQPRQEEDIVAAATGAYVWGHFTQIPPGYDQSLVAYLEDANVYWS
ncbi:MAG: hypothetical protein SVW02_01800, partial [Candidatus Nanohaloarchaea archaeon]|nr:hypothetical protein [Candidatus Nanohaloarchaea archaeon]